MLPLASYIQPSQTQLKPEVHVAVTAENLFFGRPLFKRHLHSGDPKFGIEKNVHIIFVFDTTFEGTPPFREKGHFFWVQKPWFKHHSGNALALKNCLTTKIVDEF